MRSRIWPALLQFIVLITAPCIANAQSSRCPAPRLVVGAAGVLEFRNSVEIRSLPGSGSVVGKLNRYDFFKVLEGPVCAGNGILWWKIEAAGKIGYAPEGQGRTYWAYPQPMPGVPVTAQGAIQEFEKGYMLWRQDGGSIFIFYGKNGGAASGFSNVTWAALPDNPVKDAPPAGLIKPIFGFGKLWGSDPGFRQYLGWAVGPEQHYTMTISTFGGDPHYPFTSSEHISTPYGRNISITFGFSTSSWGWTS